MGHAGRLPGLIPETLHETGALAGQIGWWAVIGIVLQAFALGGGTYTGIEAVSNNIHMLREPRTVTGRWTMTYMAISLSFAAGGLILLYLLWNVHPQYGQTLNAVTFRQILSHFLGSDSVAAGIMLLGTLSVAAGLLFVASNTGFLGGPAALANMAIDRWMPHQFAHLSNRLVTQNGVLLMAAAAIAILVITQGRVDKLVVLYSHQRLHQLRALLHRPQPALAAAAHRRAAPAFPDLRRHLRLSADGDDSDRHHHQ